MNEDVAEQRSHEEKRGGAWIVDLDDARLVRAAEVIDHDLESSSRRRLLGGCVERNYERRMPRPVVHLQGQIRRESLLGERHPLLGDTTQDDTRIFGGIRGGEAN